MQRGEFMRKNQMKRSSLHRYGLALAAFIVIAGPASAHITFENKSVAPGSTVKFVLRIPHGCSGSATTAIRVAIPDSLSEAKPQPKPGWALAISSDNVEKVSSAATPSHGEAGPVKEIAWTGGKLDDAFYDEFIFRATVGKGASGRIFVPVVQQCESGVERWIDIPSEGGASDDLKNPAPSVRVEP
jgi:uncharacterized protein YcnI